MKHEYPENFARFYDLLYEELRDSVDKNFFMNHIQKCKGKVLEVGVGTGRFFREALNRGADIYGIDISESMLRVLKEKIKKDERHRVSLQNIVDFKFDFQFDLIVAPFRVIMHLPEKEEQLKALDNVYEHLKPGSEFVFDAFIPDLKILQEGIDEMTDFEGEYEPGKKLKRVVSNRADLVNQLIHMSFRLEWEEDDRIKQENWDVPLRFYFRYELEHLIERSRFESYKIYGDYEGHELDSNSKEFLVVCRKGNEC